MTKKIVKIVAMVLCLSLITAFFSTVLFVESLKHSNGYVNFDKNKLNEVCSTIKVLDANGEELKDALYFDDNKQIPLAALHDYTYMAFVAVEDKRFFQHNGLDAKRVLGAIAHNVKSRSFKEGASTITQQLIKNTHLCNSKTIKRKVNEMLLALELEKNYAKEEILEMYLNTIYFGRSAYGIENAANVYFDKSAADLTVSESATLAGMIKAPNTYAPDKNAAKCKARRNTVLKLMKEQGIVSATDYQKALEEKLTYRPYVNRAEKTYMRQVIEEACDVLNMTQMQLFRSGYVIETYCDTTVQNALDTFARNDCTQNKDGTLADLSCLVCDNTGGVAACYFRGDSALAPKQIGSTAKPIAVYTPALCEKLITQASPVLDEPTDFSGYKPTNASGYNGWTTIKNAVTKSLNVPAVKTLNSLGVEKAQKYLNKLGLEGNQNLSLALGNVDGGLNVHSLANCYATLANGGVSNGVGYVRRIVGPNGVLYTRKPQNLRVFDSKSTYLMTDMLKNAVCEGTAKRLKDANVVTAAKTGTVGNADGNREALVAGYTSEHTFVFWYSGNMPNGVNGGTAPCAMATNVLKTIYANHKPSDFAVPNGIEQLAVDKDSLYNKQVVKLATDGEYFLFDNANKPSSCVEQKNFAYQLTTENDGERIKFALPVVDGYFWKVFKIEKTKDVELVDTQISDGEYYAQLWDEKGCVYTTPTIRVSVPRKEAKPFWHFWFLPES